MLAHFLNNMLRNILQVQTVSGNLQPPVLLSVVSVIALAILAFAAEPLARRLEPPHVTKWGTHN